MKINKIKFINAFFISLLLFLFVSFKSDQKNPIKNSVVTNQDTLNEALYVHTDRANFFPGDTLWFKAYNLNYKTLQTSYESILLNIVLFTKKGEKIMEQKYKLRSGKANGYIPLPDSLKSGEYMFVAYTKLSNRGTFNGAFSKKIIITKTNGPDDQVLVSIPNLVYKKGDMIKGTIEVRNKLGARYADLKLVLQLSQAKDTISKMEINTGSSGIKNFELSIPKEIRKEALFLNASIISSILGSKTSISIPIKQLPPSIQFFPESGVAIENEKNIIAFKAMDINGLPFDFMADIVDKNDSLIKKISSRYMGMGKFKLNYLAKDSLYCKIIRPVGYDTKYILPIPVKNSCSFNIDNC